jgi:hypothetical protein
MYWVNVFLACGAEAWSFGSWLEAVTAPADESESPLLWGRRLVLLLLLVGWC